MKKIVLSLLLAVCLCFSNIPVLAFGTETFGTEAVLSSAETGSDEDSREASEKTGSAGKSAGNAEEAGSSEESEGNAEETGSAGESAGNAEKAGSSGKSLDNSEGTEKGEGLDVETVEAQTVSGSAVLLAAEEGTISLTTSAASGTNYVWTGGTTSGTLTITGDISSEMTIALGGYSGYVLTIVFTEDVSVPSITVSNYARYYQYKFTVQLTTTNEDGADISIDWFNLSGPDEGKLIVGSNVNLTVSYLGLGASGGSNSYIELSENASLTYPLSGFAFCGQYITVDDGALFYYEGSMYLNFSYGDNGSPALDQALVIKDQGTGRMIIDGGTEPAIYFSYGATEEELPDIVQYVMDEKGYTLGSYDADYQYSDKVLYDSDGNLVTYLDLHYHHYSYSLSEDGATVSGKCIYCDETDYVTISAPENLTYDGISSHDATLSANKADTDSLSISYTLDGGGAVSSTTAMGEYTASVDYQGLTASVTYSVGKGQVTITPSDVTKVYGDDDPVLTGKITGLTGTDSIEVTYSREDGETPGTYTISASYTPDSSLEEKYDIVVNTGTLTIEKASLTVTAKDTEITYGDAPKAAGVIYSGFVNGDSASDLSGSLSYDFSYTQYGNIGEYTIILSGLFSDNYDITFLSGTLTVTAKEAVLSWSEPEETDLVYDGTAKTLTASVSNAVNGDEVEVTVSLAEGCDNVNVTEAGFSYTAVSLDNGNYVLPEDAASPACQVTPAAVTIAVNDASKTYGEADPELSGTVTGVVSGDDLEVVYSRESGEDTGSYQISASYTESANYSVTTEEAVFTIYQKAITVTADDQSSVYGDTISELTFSLSDEEKAKLVGDDDLEVTLSAASVSSEGASWPSAGSYEITGTSASANYDVTIISGTYTVTKAELTVTANDHTITYGDAPEAGGVTYSGFVYHEDESDLTGTLQFEIDYSQYGDTGEYSITPYGLSSSNYSITYSGGTLTVEPRTAVLSWSVPDDLEYDATAKIFTASVSNAVNGDEVKVTVALAEGCDNINVTEAGFSYTAVALSDSNYILPADSGSGTYYITPRKLEQTDFEDLEDVDYTGTQIKPSIAIASASLATENDYTAVYGENIEVGEGSITITGQNNFYGTVTLSFRILDRVAPSGTISIDEHLWKTFLNNITFGLFFNRTKAVNVTAYDGESGVAKTEYYLAGEEVTDLSVFSDVTWTEFEDSFDISPENCYVIYVKITDNAGNYTIINTDGVVLDSIPPAIEGLKDGKTYCAEVTFTVTDDNYDYTLVNGEKITGTEYTLPASNTTYQVQAFDKAGNESEVYTVTVNDGHVYEYTVNTGDGWAAITRECVNCGVTDSVTLSAPQDAVYDGTEHDAALSSDTIDVSSIRISYERNGEAAENTVEAGEYTASFTYGTKTVSVTYTVSRAPVTIKADSASKTYGETDPVFTGTVTGLVGNDVLDVVYYREAGEDAGSYQISASYTESANYSITYVSGILTVNPLTAELSWFEPGEAELVYDGTAKTLTASVSNAVNGDTVSVEVILAEGCDNVNVTEEGFYYIAVDINSGNYVLPQDTASPVYFITPKELTKADFDVSEADREYTGAAVTPEVSPSEGRILEENRDYTVAYGSNTAIGTGTITITGKGNYFGTLEYEFLIVQAAAEETPDTDESSDPEETPDAEETSDPDETSDLEEASETEEPEAEATSEPETQPDSTGAADTGDASVPGLYLGLMAAALGILLAGGKRKRRKLF